ncbi:hypothetical protein TSUD_283250 [Trifolium subterraneum]|uniref:Cytochrome P450 n=1 Tax=Trifolium subterraneum TaxID=3900 RepID=A0A2Z6PJF4_TRISU|nr:hypothetical protein TSUD_283250 [Trifolium subterraneum]
MATECFTKIDSAISTRPKLDATQHLAYNGAMFVFAPYGSYWRQVRKIATSEIRNHHRVEKQQHFYMIEARAWIKELFIVWCNKNDETSNFVLVEMKQWFTHLSFNIFLPMIVGKRYFGATTVIDKEEAQRFLKALQELMHLLGVFTLGDAIPFLKWFDFGGNVKAMKETSKELDKILDELLEERRHKRRLSEKVDHDFLDTLLDEKTIEEFDSDNTIKGIGSVGF